MRIHGSIALALIAITLAVYYPVHEHEFVAYDDPVQIIQNAQIHEGLSWTGVKWAFRPYESNWIPLTWISYQINYAFGGLDSGEILITNVALHALSAILLYLVLVGMTGVRWRSAFVAAIFALHPLHVESVAWATERKDVLAGVFWMLTLYSYAHYCRNPKSVGRYLLMFACLTLGLMAKPILVTLPCVLLLLDYWPLGRLRGSDSSGRPNRSDLSRLLFEKLPLFALVFAASAITFIVQHESGSVSALESLPLTARAANAIESYAIYVWMAVWPSGLAAFYPYPLESISLSRLAAASVFLLATTAFIVRNAASRPYALVGWFWYLGTLVPVIGLVQVGMQARADRYMYLPLIGLAILAAWGVSELSDRLRVPRPVIAVIAIAVLLAFGAVSAHQVGMWRDSETLYRHALAATDDNYVAHTGLGNLSMREGRFDDAKWHFSEAVRIKPRWPKATMGLADITAARGDVEQALRAYEAQLERDPNDIETIGRYGFTLGLAGRHTEARPHLRRALEARPGIAELHLSLSIIEGEAGNALEALRYAREAVRLAPDSLEAINNLAWLLATSRDANLRAPTEAIARIERAARISRDPGLLDTLAAAYAAADRFDEAVETVDRAVAEAATRGDTKRAAEYRARRALYRTGKPYISNGSGDVGEYSPPD